ncbi:MAG: putative nucleotidyltransferase [Spirosomataceae bacterium]|jgi:predicted nucleotidyltransferase
MTTTIENPEHFGLTIEEVAAMQQVFSSFTEVEKVMIYGSRVRGDYKPYSDIDMTLIGQNISSHTVTEIDFALDDLLMPYKIDLSTFDSITNNNLIAEINEFGKELYVKGKSAKVLEA